MTRPARPLRRLRPWPRLLLAYFLAPLAAAPPYLLLPAIGGLPVTAHRLEALPSTWLFKLPDFLVFGLLVELVLATPLLLAWRAWRWAWINLWTATAIGLALGLVVQSRIRVLELTSNPAGPWIDFWLPFLSVGLSSASAAAAFWLLTTRRDEGPAN